MSFLRRLLGGATGGERGGEPGGKPGREPRIAPPEPGDEPGAPSALDEPATLPADDTDAERARELELAREDAARLDELQQRQLRFAAYAWKPDDQGGSRRADETEPGEPGAD